MYAVVGCDECGTLWVLEGRPETTTCPRCGRRHRVEALRSLAEADSADAAREARSRLLAERSGTEADLADYGAQGAAVAEAGIDEDTYLQAAGVDPDEVASAGELAGAGGPSPSRRAVVRQALAELDRPTADEVAERAAEHGVDRAYVERALAKLCERGVVSETDGRYRLL